jgi:hypothetical protein
VEAAYQALRQQQAGYLRSLQGTSYLERNGAAFDKAMRSRAETAVAVVKQHTERLTQNKRIERASIFHGSGYATSTWVRYVLGASFLLCISSL